MIRQESLSASDRRPERRHPVKAKPLRGGAARQP